jgi:two-component system response regulator AtoC
MTRSILIVDDEPNMRWVLGRALEQAGYTVKGAENGDEASGVLAREPIELVLLDLKLRGEDGLTILRRIRERRPEIVVIILTAYGTVPTAVEAMQLGAADFLRKPFDVEEVLFKIARALERRAMHQEIARLKVVQRATPAFEALTGADVCWQQLVIQAQQAALTEHHVLLIGETGSGRTTLARAMHTASARAEAPLIELDLGIYRGVAQEMILFGKSGIGGAWAEAGSGTLVLRGGADATAVFEQLAERIATQENRARPRLFIVAPSEDILPTPLEVLVPVVLHVPPLRERRADVFLLARAFAGDRQFTPRAAQVLEHYTWPGNLTELRGIIQRAAHLAGADPIDVRHLPDQLHQTPEGVSGPLYLPAEGVNLEQVEQAFIRQALERARGNKSKAAELLGLTRHTLLYRMEKYGISVSEPA